ncbi:MAG: SpoVR family protein [Pirellulaceae bacterium]
MVISRRTFANLPPELVDVQQQMAQHAQDYGLDCFPTIFEVVNVDQLNAIAAMGGFPTRYPHWRFGMEYDRLSKGYHYGLQKIYELVINNDPCYAYLLDSNEFADHKLVMAHVYGHCDFFKCNHWFSKTDRKMIDQMANHGNRVRRYMNRFGVPEVEEFIDACLSIEDLIDIHSPFIQRHRPDDKYHFRMHTDSGEDEVDASGRFPAKDYMDSFINPKRKETDQPIREPIAHSVPEEPTKDVMLFLLQYAPLKPWQLDILSMLRDEAYYFAPQGQTKIMNEGWATYWHSTIMTRHGLTAAEVINYADHTSGTLASSPTSLNPYKLGLELLRDIEDRWNRGCFGQDYEDCDDYQAKLDWDTGAGLGRDKIFEVRRIHNDLTFVDEFFTLEFCRRHKMFQFGYNETTEYYEIESREFPKVKQQLLFSLTNMGRPEIFVKDGNYKNRGELYLEHRFGGAEIKIDYARDTLENLHKLWKRPVHIETVLEQQRTILSWDGVQHEIHISDDSLANAGHEGVSFTHHRKGG